MRAFNEDLSSMAENKTWLRKTLFFWQGVGENFEEAKAMMRHVADCTLSACFQARLGGKFLSDVPRTP
jgi:hypothetical protein